MSPFLEDLLNTNGHPRNAVPVDPSVIEKYRGIIPNIVLELWSHAGIGEWTNGLFRLCLPKDYSAVLALVFGGDSDFSHEDCHVIAHSAFGMLLFWSERHWDGWIDLQTGRVRCYKIVDPAQGKDRDVNAVTALYDPDASSLDIYDADSKPIYRRAVKKLGRLEHDECFGFAPIVALGGTTGIDTVRKFSAVEHYSILAQAQDFQLVDLLSRPPRTVRPIG